MVKTLQNSSSPEATGYPHHCTLQADKSFTPLPIILSRYHICKIAKYKIQKRAITQLELMFMKHYAPIRCLYIKVAKLRTGVGSAESALTKLQSQNIFKESTGGLGWGGVRMDVNEELKFL